MLSRLAITDCFLITLACAVIILAVYPSGEARQTFQVKCDGATQTFSLALGDPTLAQIQKKFGESAAQLPPANLAWARWTHELAAFYQQNTKPTDQDPRLVDRDAGSVITVSFEDSASTDPFKLGPASPDYWAGLKDRAQRAIETIETEIAKRQNTPPPVVFGEVIQSRFSLATYGIAIAAGFLISLAYATWRHFSQPIALETTGQRGEFARLALIADAIPEHASGNRIEFPAGWVRMRQPTRVLARRMALVGVVVGALICTIA